MTPAERAAAIAIAARDRDKAEEWHMTTYGHDWTLVLNPGQNEAWVRARYPDSAIVKGMAEFHCPWPAGPPIPE